MPNAGGDKFRHWAERRRHPRVLARLRIRFNGENPGRLTTENISLGGASGTTKSFYTEGTNLQCVLEPPRRLKLKGLLTMEGEILRSGERKQEKSYFAAIQFKGMKEPANRLLKEILQKLSGVDYPAEST